MFLSTSLHRIFNTKFSLGGRFYGAGYQTLPSGVRKHLLIDGQPTVELDFSGHHPCMLYHLRKLSFAGDPYKVTQDSADRDVVKELLLVLINNTGNDEGTIIAVENNLRDKGIPVPSRDEMKRLLGEIRKVHAPIAQSFNSGIGLTLQYFDSRIAERVMLDLAKAGIKALCIHDSFLVQKQHEQKLREAMIDAYKAVMGGHEPVIKP